MSDTLTPIPTLTIGGDGTEGRSHHDLRAALFALRDSLLRSQAQDSTHDYVASITAVDGILYGYDGGRLSFLAESILRQTNVLNLLVVQLAERCRVTRGIVTIGGVASTLNELGRGVFALLVDERV